LLKQIAETHRSTPRQVALRFLLREAVFASRNRRTWNTLTRMRAPEDLCLTEIEMERINKAFRLTKLSVRTTAQRASDALKKPRVSPAELLWHFRSR
jgi:diketogulonate reductase-like aldo/keto reductase